MASILRGLPDLGKLVQAMADDAERIMVSLYNLQKDVSETNATVFSDVRTALKRDWDHLHLYFQRCHGFGEDVIILKDAVGSESAEDLLEFLEDMKASANEILNISEKLKVAPLSAAFSQGVKYTESEIQGDAKFEERQRVNLDAFFNLVGQPGHKSRNEIDTSLRNLRYTIEEVYKFWSLTFQGCSALINDKGASLTKADAENITYNWNGYQEATEKAIISLAKTGDAVLVAAKGPGTQRPIAAATPDGTVNGTAKGRFALGWCLLAFIFWFWPFK